MLRSRSSPLRILFRVALIFAGMSTLAMAQQAPVTCAKCHVQAQTYPITQMARALELPGANSVLDSHPKLTVQKGDYSYSVGTHNGQTTYVVTDGRRTLSVPVLWSIGVGNQTWVLEWEGKLYESLVSYYSSIDGLDITIGDESLTPHTVEEAAGREISPSEAKICFSCHTTNSAPDGKLNFSSMHPGIGCERCHQGTSVHLSDILKGKLDTAPVALGKLSSEDLSTFCGQCHRTWETVVKIHLRGEADVRFQPYRLANSKCFDGADPRISCVACHDPHQPLVQDASFYDAKCLACHAASHRPGSPTAQGTAKICPVAKSDCVTCHMPKIHMLGVGGHITFHDHQIRIAKAGEPYPN